ncbi:phytoene desaturase family protein [Planosporangium mesophilum]|uniref:Pyridine nucleotide-disulfide oxidoreductase domain-containing protein 2 n=1 Tax=Planosporangium mesophilum TaxID=689768 RepID=A0A8J3TF33_9ACTN|nr:NAD(P)/FAD-dependent oxidoreductase [Planosporangium mesophilum]NJC84689.1 NAD(P)/FAD-dependent oxidoreductase [Planosporangium mesophilum]GII25688.1 FAD-dependent oxidoreductase [Planosporangium mesophilum]
MTTETVDAVVVGAGHNGLVAANILADAGWDVLVLEATDVPGGAVRSAELAAPGYLSDLCSAFFPFGAASPVLRELELGEHGLRWTHAPDVAAHLLPDGRAAVLNRDPRRTAASLDEFAPGDGERWLRLYERWLRISDPLMDAILRPFPPIRPSLRLLRRESVADLLRLARRFLASARALGEEVFDGEGAKVLVSGMALHTNLAPTDAASGAFGWLLCMVGQQYGFPVPVGGAQRITDALLDRLRARGGEVRCGATVDRVIVGGGRALGAGCGDGRLFRARRAVLCDVPAPALYGHLVAAGHLPRRLLADLRGFQWDYATLKVDWALSKPVPWTTEAVAGAGTVHLGVDVEGLGLYAGELEANRRPRAPFLLVGQMTTADPTRSPAGTESLWSYTHLPHRRRWSTDEIDDHVDRIEAVFQRHAPGFSDVVVGRRVTGPDELEEENPSLQGGAVNGGSAAVYQQLFFRPIVGLGRADTPVDRLYLASASAHPGGGVHGGPGANAARAALARWRPILGDLYRATVQRVQRSIYT